MAISAGMVMDFEKPAWSHCIKKIFFFSYVMAFSLSTPLHLLFPSPFHLCIFCTPLSQLQLSLSSFPSFPAFLSSLPSFLSCFFFLRISTAQRAWTSLLSHNKNWKYAAWISWAIHGDFINSMLETGVVWGHTPLKLVPEQPLL